jgi:FK506-binding nuclear protein
MHRSGSLKPEFLIVLVFLAIVGGIAYWMTNRVTPASAESYIRPELRVIEQAPKPTSMTEEQNPGNQGPEIPKEKQKEVVHDNGLKTTDLREGKGDKIKVGSTVTVFYKGMFKNGEQFDANIGKTPLSLVIGAGDVIRGWELGLMGMNNGGKRKLIIPAKLGYGEAGKPPKIPGNAELTFEIEVINVINK